MKPGTGENPMERTLEVQQREYKARRFLAMPIAGTVVWAVIGIAGLFLNPLQTVWVLFIGTGSIVYLGMFISKFTGENFLDKTKPKNEFDRLFILTVVMALLVFSIAIPFFMVDYTSLPLSVGILTGLMWVPLSWAIQHWVGIFHGVARTLLVLSAWYAFPDYRFTLIPAIIVLLYIITIVILERRWRALVENE